MSYTDHLSYPDDDLTPSKIKIRIWNNTLEFKTLTRAIAWVENLTRLILP
jgi:hypothetical protein